MPRRIGHYHIKDIIASGGMGTVYLAVQEQPRRTVALKLMKSGIASRSALRRFEFESQILARLKHPYVAEVYEAGTYDDGSGAVPYFAMEYIPGAKPITAFARSRSLGTRERLQLFTKVCEAVHQGHQKGIIHRDLKPDNILVDADGDPKVIDFGVARATDSDLALTTLQTDIGQLIGTLQYMSPEQCAADPHDIDTRSDVYAIGVILYELLCERLPYDLGGVPIHEATRIIREVTPARPSSIRRTLRGDIEWILLKALEKDRARRYASATELAADIGLYLSHRPVRAGPPSAAYRLRKFVRRNRAGVVAGSIVATSLIAAAVVSLRFALSELEQRRAATTERDIAKAVNEFLNNDLLAAVAPSAEKGRGRDVALRDVLEEAAKRIDEAAQPGGRFGDKPLVEASVRQTIGQSYLRLGEYFPAERHLKRARELRRTILGEEHGDTITSTNDLGLVYVYQGRAAEAEPLYAELLGISDRTRGVEPMETLAAMNNLGLLYLDQGRYAEAEPLFLESLDFGRRVLGEEHPLPLASLGNLARLYILQGRPEAESLQLLAAEMMQRAHGEAHEYTLFARVNLAILYVEQGRFGDAESAILGMLETCRRVQGREHPLTLGAMRALAGAYMGMDRLSEAEPLLLEAFESGKRVFGPEHSDTLWIMDGLRELYQRQQRTDDARLLTRELLAIRRTIREKPGASPDEMVHYALSLLTCEPDDLRDPVAALAVAEEANELTRHGNPRHLDVLALAYHRNGRTEEAIETQRGALALVPEGEARLRADLQKWLAEFEADRRPTE